MHKHLFILVLTICCFQAKAQYAGTPFKGTPITIPGVVEAEDFDNGGEGIAYHDKEIGIEGGTQAYRMDVGVEISAGPEGGYHVGYTNNGEWLKYTIKAETSGFYNIKATTAFNSAGVSLSRGTFRLAIDDVQLGSFSVSNTKSGDVYLSAVIAENVNITAGTHVIQLYVITGNFDKFEFVAVPPAPTTWWHSKFYPVDWTPGYKDDKGRFLHDFSYAGYMKGEAPIPTSVGVNDVDVSQAPYSLDRTGATDVTGALQNILNTVGLAGGGTVYLPEGTYLVATPPITLMYSNVILRGAGTDKTFIYCSKENMRGTTVISVAGNSFPDAGTEGPPYIMLTRDVPDEPTNTIYLEDVSSLNVHDWVIIRSDRTAEWIEERGLPTAVLPTASINHGISFYRKITAIDATEKSIEIDIPTRYYLEKRDNARVFKRTPTLSNIGLEDFSIASKANPTPTGWGDSDYNTAGTGAYQVHQAKLLWFIGAINSWAKNIESYQPDPNNKVHMPSHGVWLTACRNVTIDHCDFSYPQYRGAGGNGYTFYLASQECLISHCSATGARHSYTNMYAYNSGNVIYDFTSTDPLLESDFHMYIAPSNLIDNQHLNGDRIAASMRAAEHDFMATSQTVIWNTHGIKYPTFQGLGVLYPLNYTQIIVDSRQSGYGYVIGTRGNAVNVQTSPVKATVQGQNLDTTPEDEVEGVGAGDCLDPPSLYKDQLRRRLNPCAPAFSYVSTPENVLDGNLSTGWTAEGEGKWLDLCLAAPVNLSGIRISFGNGAVGKSSVEVFSATDGSEWSRVGLFQSSGNSTDLEEFIFPKVVAAKKIRVMGHGNTTDMQNNFSEVQVIPFEASLGLSNLAVSGGLTLTPAFAPDVLNYTVAAGCNTNAVTLTATPTDNNVALTCSGATKQGSNLNANLHDGENPVVIRLTAAGGLDSLKYTVTLVRPFEAKLNSCRIEGLEIFPEDRAMAYFPEEPISSVVLENVNLASCAAYTVNGAPYAGEAIPLTGDITKISLQVSAGSTTETYTLYVVFPEGEFLYDVERTSPQEIKVYPNPVRRGESVQLQLTEAYKGGLLRMYSVDGTLIKTEIVTNHDLFYLKLPDVLPGLYLLQITSKAKIIINYKLLIINY